MDGWRTLTRPGTAILSEAYAVRAASVAPAPGVTWADDELRFRGFFTQPGATLVAFPQQGAITGFIAYRKERALGRDWLWVPYFFINPVARGRLAQVFAFLQIVLPEAVFGTLHIGATVYPDAWAFMEKTCGVVSRRDHELPDDVVDWAGRRCEGDRYDPGTGVARMLTVPRYSRNPHARYAEVNPRWGDGFAVLAIAQINAWVILRSAVRVFSRAARKVAHSRRLTLETRRPD